MFPSIPEGGTKSRVETQVRVTVDLADSSSSSDPYRYDRVGSWKWLKLPSGTATKKRTRKQGKIGASNLSLRILETQPYFLLDPDPQDMLHLAVIVTCATPPHNRVLSCSSCQAREVRAINIHDLYQYSDIVSRRNAWQRNWLLVYGLLVPNQIRMEMGTVNRTKASIMKTQRASSSSIVLKSLISPPDPWSSHSA